MTTETPAKKLRRSPCLEPIPTFTLRSLCYTVLTSARIIGATSRRFSIQLNHSVIWFQLATVRVSFIPLYSSPTGTACGQSPKTR